MSCEHLQRAKRSVMSADVKGNAYEGLLEAAPAHPCARGIRTSCPSKNAQDTKSSAGQYFTPRALIVLAFGTGASCSRLGS